MVLSLATLLARSSILRFSPLPFFHQKRLIFYFYDRPYLKVYEGWYTGLSF